MRNWGLLAASEAGRVAQVLLARALQVRTVKKAVELLDAPSKNTVLMLNKDHSTVEIFCLSSHVFFFYPAKEQESLALKHSKKSMLIWD